ncbi:MAG: hypothetical protein V4537_03570 [Pseudomonadota bacterium]
MTHTDHRARSETRAPWQAPTIAKIDPAAAENGGANPNGADFATKLS